MWHILLGGLRDWQTKVEALAVHAGFYWLALLHDYVGRQDFRREGGSASEGERKGCRKERGKARKQAREREGEKE